MKDWIRSIGPMVVRLAAGWIALIALMVSLGMLLTGPLRDEWPLTLEDDLNTSLAANRSALANDITRWWSSIGNTLTIIVTLAVAAVVLRLILQFAPSLLPLFREGLRASKVSAGEAIIIYADTLTNPQYPAAFLGAAKDLGAPGK